MKSASSEAQLALEKLFSRPDIWQGRGRLGQQYNGIATGIDEFDGVLRYRGWPTKGLIESIQEHHQAEWLLFKHAITSSIRHGKHLVLLNPHTMPYAVGFVRDNIALNQLLVVEARRKDQFIRSFIDICEASSTGAILAWQPKQALSYSDLRKCHLASQKNRGLHVLLRPYWVCRQSSPAILRLVLQLKSEYLHVHILKQTGLLDRQDIKIDLPRFWHEFPFFDELLSSSSHMMKGGKLVGRGVLHDPTQNHYSDSIQQE